MPESLFGAMRGYRALLLLMVIIALHHFFIDLKYTGDEPRYHSYALGFINGEFPVSRTVWETQNAELSKIVPYEQTQGFFHSIIHALISAPFAYFGIKGLRTASLLYALAGLWFLHALLKSRFSRPSADIALWSAALSVPFLAYKSLFYSEAFLFFLFSVGLYWAGTIRCTSKRRFALYLVIILLPSVHIRALPLSFFLLGWSCFRFWQMDKLPLQRALLLATAVGSTALVVFFAYNYLLFGGLSASAPNKPSIVSYVPRLLIQLFSHRHGLFVYSPIFLLSFAGLMIGSIRRNIDIVWLGAGLFAYTAAMVWGTAQESYPSRFWVVCFPILIFGLAYVVEEALEKKHKRVLCAMAIFDFATLCMSAAFIYKHGVFLATRVYSIPWEVMLPSMNLIALLPWDVGGLSEPFMAQSLVRAVVIALIATLWVFLLFMKLGSKIRYAAFALLLPLFTLFASNFVFLSKLHHDKYTVSVGEKHLHIVFSEPQPINYIALREYRLQFSWLPLPGHLHVDATCGEQSLGSQLFPLRPVIKLNAPCTSTVDVDFVSESAIDIGSGLMDIYRLRFPALAGWLPK